MRGKVKKELSQDDFDVILVRDLGVVWGSHKAVFLCPICNEEKVCRPPEARKNIGVMHRACAKLTHGETGTKLYNVWSAMKSRCYNSSNERYSSYGGRGIVVCDEWKDSYVTFRDWSTANGYALGLSIDRINNNGNYAIGNCRWATDSEQQLNKRPFTRSTK